jgi:hypothetical protein
MMRRKGNTFPEQYLPSASSFRFCDDDQLRAHARKCVTVVLHTLRNMFKTSPGDNWYTFEDLLTKVRDLYPNSALDESSLKLALYLAHDIRVLSGRQMN